MSEALNVYKILEYSVFDNLEQQTIIVADGFGSYDYILTLEESNIVNLAKGFSDRTVATGEINFDFSWTNLLKSTIHWAQYFMRISQTPSLISISNSDKLRAEIEAVRQRARIRKPYGWGEANTSNHNLGFSSGGTLQNLDCSLG